jgi:hypothetical protein
VATINITATASGTSTTWTAQIEQASASTGPWTVCGSAVTITANATNTGTCTPSGSSFLEVVVTVGSGGGTLTGSLLGYPASSGSSVTFAGDLSGNNTSQTVVGVNGGAPPTDGNLGAWNSSGQPVQPTSGTLAALTVTGITDPGTGPTSTGATAGGTVGVSTENHAWCQVLLLNTNNIAGAVHSDETPLSAAVVTTSPNQTIPWSCPIVVPTQPAGVVTFYAFALCQGSGCTPAFGAAGATNTFTQTAAASTYGPVTPDPGNTTGTVLQGPATLNGGALCSAGTACAPSSVTVNSGTTVMDRCNGGTSDGMYVADGSTQATACTAGSGTLVSTGITTP